MPRFLIALTLATTVALAAPSPQTVGPGPGPGGTHIDRFEVLDVSIAHGWAALKIVEHDGAELQLPSVACGYDGMGKWPTSGVELMTWDLKAGKVVDTWTIYASTDEADKCTSTATSREQLAAAKAKIAALGLDITRKPAFTEPSKDKFALTIGGKPLTVGYDADTTQDPNEDDGEIDTAALSIGGTPFYTIRATNTRVMAEHRDLAITGAYVEGTKAVFLQRAVYGNMRMDDETTYSLSPVFELGE